MRSRYLLTILLVCLFCLSKGQSTSANYSSNADGYFTHGAHQTSTNSTNKSINNWGAIDTQFSVSYINKTDIGFAKDTSTIGITDVFLESNLVLYPNPFHSAINFELPSLQDAIHASITDVHGKDILSIILDPQSNTLDLSNLPNGLYFIKFQSGNQTATRKIIKIE